MHASNRIVSQRFRDRTLEIYPQLRENSRKNNRRFRFFEFLVFSPFVDRNATMPHKVVFRPLLLDLLGLPLTTGSKTFKSTDFLEECQATIPLLKLDWSGYDHTASRARVITNDGLSDEFRRALTHELTTFHTVPPSERVRFITGERVRATTTTDLRSEDRHRATHTPPTTATAKLIVDYLNSLPPNVFTSKVHDNFQNAVMAAEALPKAAQRTLELSKLHRILTQPQPFYGASDGEKTVRVFAKNTSILGLKNVVKYALIDGWTTFDLKSAQLAIVAKDWNIALLHGWLSDPSNDVWRELCGVFPNVPMTTAKPVVKIAIYSACYGAEFETIQRAVVASLGVTKHAAVELMKHELFIHLLAHRVHQLRELRKRKKATDCFGQVLRCQSKRQARSVLAQLSQAREMQLLSPAVDFAMKRAADMRIVLWEHDGFSVHFRREPERNERTKRGLVEAVNKNCRKLGYPTELVEK